MSFSNKIIEGEKVPVVLQVQDGNENLFPQAIIRNQNNVQIALLDLGHTQNGEYVPSAPYLMPSEEYIKIQFKVYEDAGHTIESTYSLDIDVFTRELVHERTWDEQINDHLQPGSTGETLNLIKLIDIDSILSKLLLSDVVARIEDDEPIVGVVDLNEDNVAFQIAEDENIFAFVGEIEEIQSNIDGNNDIIGVTNEC